MSIGNADYMVLWVEFIKMAWPNYPHFNVNMLWLSSHDFHVHNRGEKKNVNVKLMDKNIVHHFSHILSNQES